MKLVPFIALCFAVGANASGVSIFPSLRKRMAKQHKVLAQTSSELPKAPAAEDKDDKETQDAPTQEVPAAVPAPLDAGTDGFPQLPAVSQMLSAASGTLKTVNTQASSLEARVVQAQMRSESKMAKQKAAFEEKLRQQEQTNQGVIAANANISAEIKSLKSSNAGLRKHAHEIGENNKLMRTELKTLQARLAVAKDFTGNSLTTTDDSKNTLLQVLKGGRRHKHVFVETASKTQKDDDDDDDDDEDDDDKSNKDDDDENDDDSGTSFLAVSTKKWRRASEASQDSAVEAEVNDVDGSNDGDSHETVGPAMPEVPAESPGDLLAVLSKQVANLANQEKESEKNLKTMFIRDFRAGAKRHQALLAQQKSLAATRGSLQGLQAKLRNAVAHLKATQSQLEGRLHGIGQYLQKLAHFAMAPQKEAPHLLEVLPKTVTVKVV